MAETVHVPLGARSYDILVGERLLADAGKHIAPLLASSRVIIISDETVARLYLHRLTGTLDEHKIHHRSIIIKPGEQAKNTAAFVDMLEHIIEQKPDRKTTLIALGGGVVGDVAGFAASVLLRGVDFIQIPTTLLSQVDSSVGGKTGINSKFGKNLIGSFHQPKLVLADVSVLSSLPRRELLAGYAEMLKYGLIGDAAFFTRLEQQAPDILQCNTDALIPAIVTSCKAKAAIVAADEKESGARALLNFGHTFAHALEAETGYGDLLLHGEAVAIGMILAFKLSVKMGLCGVAEVDRVQKHYRDVGLPLSPRDVKKDWNMNILMDHIARDKKAKDGALTFILTRGVGKAFVANDMTPPLVQHVLVEACSNV